MYTNTLVLYNITEQQLHTHEKLTFKCVCVVWGGGGGMGAKEERSKNEVKSGNVSNTSLFRSLFRTPLLMLIYQLIINSANPQRRDLCVTML